MHVQSISFFPCAQRLNLKIRKDLYSIWYKETRCIGMDQYGCQGGPTTSLGFPWEKRSFAHTFLYLSVSLSLFSLFKKVLLCRYFYFSSLHQFSLLPILFHSVSLLSLCLVFFLSLFFLFFLSFILFSFVLFSRFVRFFSIIAFIYLLVSFSTLNTEGC